jgi:hypothetical protein
MNSQIQRIQAQFRLLSDQCGKALPDNVELPQLLTLLGSFLQDQENQIASLKSRVNHLEKQLNEHQAPM